MEHARAWASREWKSWRERASKQGTKREGCQAASRSVAAERPRSVAARATAVWRSRRRRRRRWEKAGERRRRDQRRQTRERAGREAGGTRERQSKTMSSGSEDRVVTGAGELVWGCGGEGNFATASFGLGKHDFTSHVKWRELQLSLSLSELIS